MQPEEKFFKTSVAPWVGKFNKTEKKDDLLVLVASDFHAQWTDKFSLKVFLDTAKRMQPDVICLNGDVLDLYGLSRYTKDPTGFTPVQAEINYIVGAILAPLRAACPNAQIDFGEGNHEWRLINYLCEAAPGLAGLECLEFGKLFHLDDYEINLVARKAFRKTIIKSRTRFENFVIYGKNALLVTHGTASGGTPAKQELARWGMNGISGHLHKPSSFTGGSGLIGVKTWHSIGCMARTALSRQYMEAPAQWMNGFAYAEIHGRTCQITPVSIQDGFCSVAGLRYYKEKPKIAVAKTAKSC